MEYQLNDFEDGKPLKSQSPQLAKAIKQLKSGQKFKEMLELADTLQGQEKYIVKANALLYMNRSDQVLKVCEQGLKLGEDSQFYNLRSRAYGKIGKFKDKVKNAEIAISMDPNVPAYYRNKGAGLYKLKQYQKALQCHARAIQLQPKNAINYHNRGAAYFRMGKFEQAKKHFNEAVAIDKKLGLAFAWLGNSEYQLKNLQKALQCYQKAFEITKNPEYTDKIKKVKKQIQENDPNKKSLFQKFKGIFK